jgi:hypothetical protein
MSRFDAYGFHSSPPRTILLAMILPLSGGIAEGLNQPHYSLRRHSFDLGA